MQRLKQLTCLILVLLNVGCIDITHVQTGYVADRDECRGRSENNVGVYAQPESYGMSDKDKNVALLQLFCECMKEKDWKVAGCPKPVAPVQVAGAPQQPTVVAMMAEPEPAPAAAPAPMQGKKRKKAVCNPPNTCPAPTIDYSSGGQTQAPAQSDQQLQNILQRQ